MTGSDCSGCDDYLAHLYEYIDGELSEQECAALRSHLEGCPPCLDEYQRDALLKALIRRSCRCEHAPASLRTQIMTQITTVTITHVQFGEG